MKHKIEKEWKPEILAPVGRRDSLSVALQEGADAVFFGSGRFHARSQSVGLAVEDLPEIMAEVKRYGKKAYLTMNTLVYPEEMADALALAAQAYEAGVDALIVQDIGLAYLLRMRLPQMELHASTQMAVHSSEALAKAAALGIKRVVLPRELSLLEIRSQTKLARQYGMETEVFVHGALCICYSGHCQLSRQIGGRSANRGACAQPCRLTYSFAGQENSLPLLSPKDISYLDYLPELVAAGVASFKIEGRMRSPSYVREAVRSFRQKLLTGKVSAAQKQNLLQVFNRGGAFTQARLFRQRGKGILSGAFVGHLGLLYGKVTKIIPAKGVLIFKPSQSELPSLAKGDVLAIRDAAMRELASAPIGTVSRQGDYYEVKGFHPAVLQNLNGELFVYRSKAAVLENETPEYLADSLRGNQEQPKDKGYHDSVYSLAEKEGSLPVDFTLQSKPSTVDIYCLRARTTLPDGSVLVASAEKAREDCQQLLLERCVQQLGKLGNTPYVFRNFSCETDVFLRISSLNALRRKVVEKLEVQRNGVHLRILTNEQKAALTASVKFTWEEMENIKNRLPILRENEPLSTLAARLVIYLPGWRKGETLPTVLEQGIRSFLPFVELAGFYEENPGSFADFLQVHRIGAVVPPGAPLSIYEKVEAYIPKWHELGLHAQVASGLSMAACPDLPLYLLPDANVTNSVSVQWYIQQGVVGLALAHELTKEQRERMTEDLAPLEIFKVLGADEAMTFEHCPVGFGVEGCRRCSKQKLFAMNSPRDEFWYLPLPSQACSGKLYARKLKMEDDFSCLRNLHNMSILLTILPGQEKEIELIRQSLIRSI